ncbi:MAG: peptidylprolyl isomerase, partial [Bdellovibrionales bacterium]
MRILLIAIWSFLIMGTANAQENTLIMDTTKGKIVIETMPELAPLHVERITKLASEGFYDGVVFHRVIDGFMAQTGDPTGTGYGGSDYPDLPAEFNDTNFSRGVIGMARTSDPDSANSQFFICFDDCSFLNNQYTVWGKVVEGMENVDEIKRGEPPVNPDKIVSFRPVGAPASTE